MDTRPPPFAHPRPPSTSHDHSIPPSPYAPDAPRNIPPPPSTLHQDPFYRPHRQTFESIAASTPRPDTRPATSYAPPPPPPYSGAPDHYPRDSRDVPGDRREGYGLKRSHEQAMAGEPVENGRPDSRRLHYDSPHAAAGHQRPSPFSHNAPLHPSGAPPHAPSQHAPDHQQMNNGNMYQVPVSRSPPPPSPYGSRPMPPPGSPQYTQTQYGPHGPQQGPLPPPPFSRDPGISGHRPGVSLTSILGGEAPRPPQDSRYGHMNGSHTNGHGPYGEREGSRPGPPYAPTDARSQTPDRFGHRNFDYNRPARAMSTGERPPFMADRSPEKYGFGGPLPHSHEPHDPRGAHPLPPHSSAPGSRRQSVGGAPPSTLSRPQTSVGPPGPEPRHHLGGHPFDHHPMRDSRDFHRDGPRPPPPPMPPVEEIRNEFSRPSGERRIWEQEPVRPPYREEPIPAAKPFSYPYASHLPQQAPEHHPIDVPRPAEPTVQHSNGHGPVYGPEPRPGAFGSDAEKRGMLDGRKSSVDSMPTHYHARLESPIQKHRHVMDRTNSTRSEHTPSRLLNISAEHARRAASPLPQAVQGAQAPAKGPTSEAGIKAEFGRMFAGIAVTPTPTPVELVHKRYSSPAEEAPGGGRSTPGLGRLDPLKRTNSGIGKRRRNKDDGYDDVGSPIGEIPRSVGGKGLKRSRNSYIEGLGIHRGDTGSPFGRRAYTPTSLGHHPKRERKPRTIVRSQAVLDAVKDKPRKHLGSMLYQIEVDPVASVTAYSSADPMGNEKFGFGAAPTPIPKFEDKENCTFTVRVPREHLTKQARIEVCGRRNLWGTEVYTDDTDPLAAAIHAGWVRGEWGNDVDISMLSIGKEKEREERVNNNAIGPNGRTSLSVSVSPELSRKSLAPYANGTNGGNTSGSDHGASRKNSEAGTGDGSGKATQNELLTSVPNYPLIPPAGKDVHITLLLLPRLQQYASTVQNGIKSRAWTTAHDGNSFMIHSVQFMDEGTEGRRNERGPTAKHARLQELEKQSRGLKRKLSNNFSRGIKGRTVAAVGA